MSKTRLQSATSTRSSGTSGSFDVETKRYNHPSSAKPTGRRMLYTGPTDALFHRVSVEDQGMYIGIAPMSSEFTSQANYLYKATDNNAPLCRWRQQRVGEIGWNVSNLLKNSVLPVKIDPGRR
ncbi:protein SPMIP2-like [Clavelina lepadiformis]|uniref:Uncharacterized protein n=1 Tax=Clavelina lepadiformis TaxID=159417 RepID=A0ABP0FGX3_CLALP